MDKLTGEKMSAGHGIKIFAGVGIAAAVTIGAVCYDKFYKGKNDSPVQSQATSLGTSGNPERSSGSTNSNDPVLKGSINSTASVDKSGKNGFKDDAIDSDPKLKNDKVARLKPDENEYTKKLSAKKNKGKITLADTSVMGSKGRIPFDKKLLDDPIKMSEYLSRHEPSRVHDVATVPGPNVPVLRFKSPRFVDVIKGESVTLKVKTAPKAPVTFTSVHLGTFSNKLTSITVQADKSGIARVDFTASGGAIGDCEVLAGSPLATEQRKFVIHIKMK